MPTDTLKALLTLLKDLPSRKEFTDAFAAVSKVIKDTKKSLEDMVATKLAALQSQVDTLSKEVKDDAIKDIATLKTEVAAQVEKALKEQGDGMNFIHDKVRNLKQAADGVNGIDGRPGIDGQNGKDGSPDTAEQIADKLDSVDYLKTIFDEVDKLKRELNAKIDTIPRGGARSSHSTRLTDLSAQTNGSLKVFSVPEGLAGLLFSSDFPSVLMEGNGFTLNKTRTQLTMTTDNAPSTGSQLVYQSVDISNTY